MDDNANSQDTTEAAKEAAAEAANEVKTEVNLAIGKIKGRGLMGFLNFDMFYFPVIARLLFIVVLLVSILGTVLGVVGGIIGIFTNFFGGIVAIVMSIVMGILGIFMIRVWFEMMLIGFKINENLQRIREKAEK